MSAETSMPAITPLRIGRRAVLAGGLAALVGSCVPNVTARTAPGSAGPAAPDPVRLTAEQVLALVKSNQIVFVRSQLTGEIIMETRCSVRVPYTQISKYLLDGFVAIEDKRFYMHNGSDPLAYPRVVASLGGAGGSTITQQTIKAKVLTDDRGFISGPLRKIDEMFLAELLETVASKTQILEYYANGIYYGVTNADQVPGFHSGQPIYGVETAARYYFGRRARDLDLYQSAVIAALVNAPRRYNPLSTDEKVKDRLKTRVGLVLDAMVDQGMISDKERRVALKAPPRARGGFAPMFPETRDFTDWVLRQLAADFPDFVPDASTRIPITLQAETQFRGLAALQASMGERADTEADCGFVTMSHDGRIVLMLGQKDRGQSQLNHVTQTKRQPASTFKSFVYLAALETGKARFNHALVKAFAVSDNARALELGRTVTSEVAAATANRLGIATRLRPDESLPLGTSEVTLLELTTAYAAFASGGLKAAPYGHLGLIQAGKAIYWRQDRQARRVIDSKPAKQMQRLLRAVITDSDGTGTAALRIEAASGKTGTSNDRRDALFVGFTPRHVSGLWIGRDDNKPMTRANGPVAAAVWADVEAKLPTA